MPLVQVGIQTQPPSSELLAIYVSLENLPAQRLLDPEYDIVSDLSDSLSQQFINSSTHSIILIYPQILIHSPPQTRVVHLTRD